MGQGRRLTPEASHRAERLPSGATRCCPRRTQHSAEHRSQRDSNGSARQHTCAHSKWAADPEPDCSAWRRAAVGGRAPNHGCPPHNCTRRPPKGRSPATLTARESCGTVAGPPRPHRPLPGHTGCPLQGQAAGDGEPLTPIAPRNSERSLPRFQDGQPGEDARPNPGAPHDGQPHGARRWLARAHAVASETDSCWERGKACHRTPLAMEGDPPPREATTRAKPTTGRLRGQQVLAAHPTNGRPREKSA